LLLISFADSTRQFVVAVQEDTLHVPPPRPGIENWPVIGKPLHGAWSKASTDLPSFLRSIKPQLSSLAQRALGMTASIGGGLLLFIGSFIVAGIVMAYGESAAGGIRAVFIRLAGDTR